MGRPVAERFWEKVDASGGDDACWPWTGSLRVDGYGQFYLRGVLRKAPRISYELTHGPLAERGPGYHGWCICHTCDNRKCVNPRHLFVGTNADNMADMKAKGRRMGKVATFGESVGTSKLRTSDVVAIRADTRPRREIAQTYDVSVSLVGLIKTGRIWKRAQHGGG